MDVKKNYKVDKQGYIVLRFIDNPSEERCLKDDKKEQLYLENEESAIPQQEGPSDVIAMMINALMTSLQNRYAIWPLAQNGSLTESSAQNVVRVRQMIPFLHIEISNKKIKLPKGLFTEKYDAVTYPYSIVKHKSYADFGLCMEYIVMWKLWTLFGDKFHQKDPSWKTDKFDIRCELKKACLSDKDINDISQEILNTLDDIYSFFKKIKAKKVVWQHNLLFEKTSGHPDLVIYLSDKNVSIYDVKVFARSTGKSNDCMSIRLQMASYIYLARKMGLTVNKVGIIMPWRRVNPVVEYDVGKWNSEDIGECINIATKNTIEGPMHQHKWNKILHDYNVGSHVTKDDALRLAYLSTQEPIHLAPIQFFIYGKTPSKEQEQKDRKKIIEKNLNYEKQNAFVHAPYNLNLCDNKKYIYEAMIMYMKDCDSYGLKGVVFHVGHNEDPSAGMKNLRKNMNKLFEKYDGKCAAMIESPCGDKNSLLSNPNDLINFVNGYPQLKICVDTCHVFVAGYMPIDYITTIGVDKISLIHFNGSRKLMGSKADGHAHVSTIQKIPDEQLLEILEISKKYKIACLTE